MDPGKHEADVALDVTPGPWARIAGLTVEGTKRVDPKLVERMVGLEAGKPFDLTAVDDARARAYALGVFSSVRATYELVPGHPDQVRVERVGRVIHHYGHGGAGYTLARGSAVDVAALARS